MFDRVETWEERMAALEVAVLQSFEKFRNSMMEEFAKLHAGRSEKARDSSSSEESVMQYEMVGRKVELPVFEGTKPVKKPKLLDSKSEGTDPVKKPTPKLSGSKSEGRSYSSHDGGWDVSLISDVCVGVGGDGRCEGGGQSSLVWTRVIGRDLPPVRPPLAVLGSGTTKALNFSHSTHAAVKGKRKGKKEEEAGWESGRVSSLFNLMGQAQSIKEYIILIETKGGDLVLYGPPSHSDPNKDDNVNGPTNSVRTTQSGSYHRPLWWATKQSLSYLDGSLPGDLGFDPLGLSDPEGTGGFIEPRWLAYGEIINGRFAMLGAAGAIALENLGKAGLILEETALPWFKTGVIPPAGTYDYWADPYTLCV